MSTYLQLGHDSWNLLEEPDGGVYRGAILSPVNDSPDNVIERLRRLGENRQDLEIILDPQLYNPSSQRGKLATWQYYSSEFETADASDSRWWDAKAAEIVNEALRVGATAVCSPAQLPRTWSNEYYRFVVDVANSTSAVSASMGVDTLLTAIIPLNVLADPRRVLEIASVLSSSRCDRIYLAFLAADGLAQREPLRDTAALASAVHLVRLLSYEHRVHVGCAGHDVVLWRAAGAVDASSGKYMNVRRFSPARWQDEETEGRQIPYWNEDRLLTLIRDSDALILHRKGWFKGRDFSENPSSLRIFQGLLEGKGTPWQKLSWLQYLRWFSNIDTQVHDAESGEELLTAADGSWAEVERMKVLFNDRYNDGGHVRSWINALREGMAR